MGRANGHAKEISRVARRDGGASGGGGDSFRALLDPAQNAPHAPATVGVVEADDHVRPAEDALVALDPNRKQALEDAALSRLGLDSYDLWDSLSDLADAAFESLDGWKTEDLFVAYGEYDRDWACDNADDWGREHHHDIEGLLHDAVNDRYWDLPLMQEFVERMRHEGIEPGHGDFWRKMDETWATAAGPEELNAPSLSRGKDVCRVLQAGLVKQAEDRLYRWRWPHGWDAPDDHYVTELAQRLAAAKAAKPVGPSY